MSKHRLFASVMAADYRKLEKDLHTVIEGGVDGLHFDVMDGNFVPNITFGKDLIAALRPVTDLPFDVHLMVTKPDLIAPQVIEAGANRVAIHPEAEGHLQRSLTHIRALGAQPGVALDPAIPPEMIQWVLDDVDYVLVLSVNPGCSGQEFIPSSRRKIAALVEMIEKGGHNVTITLDGGVEPENIGELARLGVNDFVSGGSIFYHRPAADQVREFRKAIQ
jgi:ribulose-phosphate 3-epimerase